MLNIAKFRLFLAIFAIFLFLTPSSIFADFSFSKWQWQKDINLAKTISEKRNYVELVFDEEVFKNSKSDLSDIRIINSQGEEDPYILKTETPESYRESNEVKILDKGFVENEMTTFVVDLEKEGILHNNLKILIDPKNINFRRSVKVEGSNDKNSWLIIADKEQIYDYTFEFKAQDAIVSYPEITFRFLKVTIFDKQEKSLNILGAEVFQEVTTVAKKIDYKANIITESEDVLNKASILIFDLGKIGLPTNRLSLMSDDSNFSREVALEGSKDNKNWSIIILRDVIFSFDTPKFKGNKLFLEYPDKNFRYFRLTIFNKDNKPIKVNSVSAAGFLRKLVFQYNPDLKYQLYYGNTKAQRPEYDLEKYFKYFGEIKNQEVILSPQKNNPKFEQEKIPEKPFTERYPNLLLAVLIVVVLIVGGLTLKLFIKTAKKE